MSNRLGPYRGMDYFMRPDPEIPIVRRTLMQELANARGALARVREAGQMAERELKNARDAEDTLTKEIEELVAELKIQGVPEADIEKIARPAHE